MIMREVVNGLMYVLSTGCQWRAIPKDLPPKSTVYDYFDLWTYDGTLQRIHYALYDQLLVQEVLSRNLRDRRAVARYGGLTGSPDESGKKRREKGLARSGNARVRRGMIQLARPIQGGPASMRRVTTQARKSRARSGMFSSIH